MRTHFIELMRYTGWANDLLIDDLTEHAAAGLDMEEALRQMTHLLRAQDVWRGRVEQTEAAGLPLWVVEPPAACAARSAASIQGWLALLERSTPADLEQPIAYTNTKGRAFETPLRQIVAHVINHSTHHRAQAVRLLRQAGLVPPVTDFIYYLRQQQPGG